MIRCQKGQTATPKKKDGAKKIWFGMVLPYCLRKLRAALSLHRDLIR